jgi:hypothetical protein
VCVRCADSLLTTVLSFLSTRDIIACCAASARLRAVGEGSALWKALYLADFKLRSEGDMALLDNPLNTPKAMYKAR